VLAFSTEELVGPTKADIVYVGPSITERPDDTPLPELDGRPVILVSLGTANAEAGAKFLRTAVEALAELPDYQGIVVDPTGEVTDVRRVPQLALLPKCAAVVCHAGHNTVCEALSHGVPLVVAPIRDDQPIVAQRVPYGRVTAEQLREAITEALGHAEGARRIQSSFASAGGAEAAANWLSELAATRMSELKR
jgi:MGT family glycosyltransferase